MSVRASQLPIGGHAHTQSEETVIHTVDKLHVLFCLLISNMGMLSNEHKFTAP